MSTEHKEALEEALLSETSDVCKKEYRVKFFLSKENVNFCWA